MEKLSESQAVVKEGEGEKLSSRRTPRKKGKKKGSKKGKKSQKKVETPRSESDEGNVGNDLDDGTLESAVVAPSVTD